MVDHLLLDKLRVYGVAGDLLCGEAPDSLQECLPLRHGASLMHPFCSNIFPREEGGGRPYMGYIGMCCCEGYGFRDRVYKSESLGLGEGIIFQETDQLAEDFSLV